MEFICKGDERRGIWRGLPRISYLKRNIREREGGRQGRRETEREREKEPNSDNEH